MNTYIKNRKRISCLGETLVRLEFSPDGNFEDRRSMVAYEKQSPINFTEIKEDANWTVLLTGKLEIRIKEDDLPFNRNNLEMRWVDNGLMQAWRPGDRDYCNLGGTLRSLDRYGKGADLDGVHVAGMESPDLSGINWPAWLQCEEEPLYTDLHPAPAENVNRGPWLKIAKEGVSNGRCMERTFNWYVDASKFCPGIISRSGYYFLNDSDSAVMDEDDFPIERNRPGSQDWYFFGYGKDYKQALQDYRLLSGPAPLPTHKTLGIIFSRWPAFTEAEAAELVINFKENGYPMSTLVMDMEWHKEGWGHWEFNDKLLPDPQRFIDWCHANDLELTFNDHPLDVREDDATYEDYCKNAGDDVLIRERKYNDKTLKMAKVDITDKQQNLSFCKSCHKHILDMGLDYWWNDGSRGNMIATNGQLVANKTFFEEVDSAEKRGMYLARYGGLGSHRYGGFFTGDTEVCYDILKLECEFNIRGANLGLNYISHDMGGFFTKKCDLIDRELYIRWVQFGVFNPILRFHCAPGSGSRKPWDYDSEDEQICQHWLRVRHSLFPYIYSAFRENYETGISVTKGMFLEEPENDNSYRFDQFYFGDNLIVAPILTESTERSIYLPEGLWWEFDTSKTVKGKCEISRNVALKDIPVYVKAGSIICRKNPDGPLHETHTQDLILDIYPGADGENILYEDDGKSNAYKNKGFCKTGFTLSEKSDSLEITGRVIEGKPFGTSRNISIILPEAYNDAVLTLNKNQIALNPEILNNGRIKYSLGEVETDKTLEIKLRN